MYFLFNLGSFLSDIVAEAKGTFLVGLRTICYWLASIIYKLIIDLYELFDLLCGARLLNSTLMEDIATRVGIILGIVMLFNVLLSFIKMLIEPDSFDDKEKGAVSIIKKTIIVIVMLGVSNFCFESLYKIQRLVVKSNVISNLILPYTIEEESLDNFGALLSEELMMSFYTMEQFSNLNELDDETRNKIDACDALTDSLGKQIINKGRFDLGYMCLDQSINVKFDSGTYEQDIFIINFSGILCVAAGIAVVYLLFMYCFKIGIRMVQLMFLEVIAPVAIVSYLSPKKDTAFSKWTKIYTATYIDVFIRVIVINFVVFLIATVLSNNNLEEGMIFWKSVGNPSDFWTRSFFKVVIILALLTFAKKAPELIKELLPASASKLGFGASMKDIVGLEKSVSTLAGAATGAAVGFLGGKGIGAIGGVFRGARAGFGAKGIGASFGAARKSQAEHNQLVRQGAYPGISNSLLTGIGASTLKESYDKQISDLEESIQQEKVDTAQIRRKSAAYSQVTTAKGNIEDRAEKKLFSKSIDANKHKAMADKQRELLALRANVETLKNSGAHKNVIATAERAYFSKLDETKKSYITYAMKNSDFDAGMTAMFGDLKNTVQINADGAFNGMTFNTNSYDDLDSFETGTTTANNVLAREIAVSDAKIQGIENTIQSVKNEPGYINSHKIK